MSAQPEDVAKAASVPMQLTSDEIYRQKYQLHDRLGNPIDQDIEATYARVARALADIEPTDQEKWYEKFLWALREGAIPAGRITSNAGAEKYKPATSTINCTVSRHISDSMNDILGAVHSAGLTLKAGCGIGYSYGTLRPRGAYVKGAGATTSGPVSFMDIFDKMCFTVSSAGGRRGAQMATMDIHHPDVEEFIRAKREDGRLRQFNMSLLVSDDFIEAVKNDEEWKFSFPILQAEAAEDGVDVYTDPNVVWRRFPIHDEKYFVNEEGLVACKVYKTIQARHLWNMIMTSTYDYAEPGVIFIDRVNDKNNNWFCEDIQATNP